MISMKPGHLQESVISVLRTKSPMSVREILAFVNKQTKNQYAYSTIATTLSRLEKKRFVLSYSEEIHGRSMKLFELQPDAPNVEVNNILQNLISKFGLVGVKHLGQVFKENISKEEIEEIKQKFEIKDK
ncbi:MAG: hypothetical protein HeimC3_31540 [Candidatus Heimdallarchaeota archaeon LC_3]|nr:MAG: hypothetical protein HeimC3_31540 [Candidatus Heimdallarchaeota archaeon LC_3]